MRDPSRVRVAGLLESYAEDFRDDLAGRGYSPDAAAVQLQVMGHLSGWLAGRGLGSTGLTPAVVDAYLAERRSLGGASHWTRRALAPLLGFLQGREVAPAEVPPGPAGPVEALLGRYACWLAAERGLAETTIRRNVELVRPFVAGWERAGRVALEHLCAGDVTAFVVARCQHARGGTAPRMVTALRSLLRFVHVEGSSTSRWPAWCPRWLPGSSQACPRRWTTARSRRCWRPATGPPWWDGGTWRSSRCWCGWGCARGGRGVAVGRHRLAAR
jgi:integrase/recombinase XerD